MTQTHYYTANFSEGMKTCSNRDLILMKQTITEKLQKFQYQIDSTIIRPNRLLYFCCVIIVIWFTHKPPFQIQEIAKPSNLVNILS